MLKKILGILPESIGGRLTLSSLLDGFKYCGFKVDLLDKLNPDIHNILKSLNICDYAYLVSYDYTAIELKNNLHLDIPTINYFSDEIDSNLAGKYWQEYFDELIKPDNYTFYWDKELTNRLKKRIPNIYFLPHAINTNVYKNLHLEPEYDIMFAGRLTFNNRLQTVSKIAASFPQRTIALFGYRQYFDEAINKLNSPEKEQLSSCYKGFIESETEMAQAINKAKLVLNFTSQGIGNLNYRLFQTLSCETFLLTDYRPELDELFTPGEDVIYYEDEEDLIHKIDQYFSNPDKYHDIVKAGRMTIEKNYSCQIAAQKILDIVSVFK